MPRILVVDDSATERAYCVKILSQLGGVQILECTDGESCLANVKNIKPDLIILDVVMPQKNGYETCRTLKRDPATKSIPVIMLTSKGEKIDVMWGMKQGAEAYLTKPADPDTLLEAVKKYVASPGTPSPQ